MANFSNIFGQDAAVSVLRRALESDCLPGTYLFIGAKGVGKGALAQAFAQSAACLTPKREPFDACGVCDSCVRAEKGTQPEIVTVMPAGEQMQIWQFWDRDNRPTPGVLSRTMNYAPTVGKRRLYIIEQAETLTESAANSLLKVLEEPPPYAVFVLLAPHPARVLPTIVSRSQMVRLRAVPTAELAAWLQTAQKIEPERAEMLAAYTEGRIGQAAQMARHPAVGEEIKRILDFAESLPDAPQYRALRVAEQIRKLAAQVSALLNAEAAETADKESADGEPGSAKERAGRRQISLVFDLLTVFYRDLLALKVGGNSGERIVNRDRIARLKRMAQSGSPDRWMNCLDALLMARRRLDANANVALVTEILAMRLLT